MYMGKMEQILTSLYFSTCKPWNVGFLGVAGVEKLDDSWMGFGQGLGS